MKTAGIREFKAQLSQYLREVQSGETVLVTDRGRVVAEVRPPGAAEATLEPAQVRYRQAVEAGIVRPATASPEERQRLWSRFKGLRLPPGTVQALLDEDRRES